MKMKSVYESWSKSGQTINIKNSKYKHSCPLEDFLKILSMIINISEENPGKLFMTTDIVNYLVDKEIYPKQYFKSNKYKITVVINVLLLEKILVREKNRYYYIEDKNRLINLKHNIEG